MHFAVSCTGHDQVREAVKTHRASDEMIEYECEKPRFTLRAEMFFADGQGHTLPAHQRATKHAGGWFYRN